jgi:hypothetical protein
MLVLMTDAAAPARELACRESAGIHVRLVWQSLRNRVSVHVSDARTEDTFAFEVAPADALDAFHHPFAYAPRPDVRAGPSQLALQS